MKRARVLLVVLPLLCWLGFVSVVMANPTSTETGSSQDESNYVVKVKDGWDDSDFFLEDWWYSFLDYDCGYGGPGCNDTDTCPVQTIPAPGALVLGDIGLSLVGGLRRRRTL